jgi:L-fucose dehydrogenase
MDLQVRDKVVLITGGAKGIGAAIARGAANEGAIPVLVDKDSEAGHQLQSELRQKGAKCGLICDVLVNSAGINDGVGLENGSPDKYWGSLQRNLLHYYAMACYALPALKASQGCIVSIASKTALTGQGGTSCGLTRPVAIPIVSKVVALA